MANLVGLSAERAAGAPGEPARERAPGDAGAPAGAGPAGMSPVMKIMKGVPLLDPRDAMRHGGGAICRGADFRGATRSAMPSYKMMKFHHL